MEPRAAWTLDELVGRVAAALSVGYQGPASRRVRDLPDQRVVRYYTTAGLVDRPSGTRGRTALYGRRHLLQLVAIKRLQAAGLTLAQIQAELAGAADAELARIAGLPAGDADPARAAQPRPAAAPARTAPTDGPARTAPTDAQAGAQAGAQVAARGARFWAARPAAAAAHPAQAGLAADQPAPPAPQAQAEAPGRAGASLQGVRLGGDGDGVGGAILLLEAGRALRDGEVRALRQAARPLLAAIRALGLDRAGEPERPPHAAADLDARPGRHGRPAAEGPEGSEGRESP